MPILDIHTPTYSFEMLDTRFVEECKAAYNTKRAEYSVEGQASHMDERYLLKKTEQRKTTKIRKNEKKRNKNYLPTRGEKRIILDFNPEKIPRNPKKSENPKSKVVFSNIFRSYSLVFRT